MMARGPKIRVLIIEDEPLISMAVEDAVTALGYAVIGPVADIDEAWKLVEAGGFDCAVLDINIRGGTTFGIADLFLARGCPFVLATGYSDWSMPAELTDKRRLSKPFTWSELEAELRLLASQVKSKVSS